MTTKIRITNKSVLEQMLSQLSQFAVLAGNELPLKSQNDWTARILRPISDLIDTIHHMEVED